MSETSALAAAADRVGDRWSLLLVDALLQGPRRFNELQAQVGGIAPNVLSSRLKQLEAAGVVVAASYSERPQRFAYELSPAGRELAGVLRLLAQWGAAHAGGSEAVRHQACGTPAEARWYCPTCARVIDDEVSDLTYV
jgi:DNA-binding HxlR family transcriptional regulator